MAQNFIVCDREQTFLMAPDVRDWLPENHFAVGLSSTWWA
jgi:hypothetical protein